MKPAGSTVCHAPDGERGWRGSMAAALQASRHVHIERVRQPIQCVMALALIVGHPCYCASVPEARCAVVGDWQAFIRLGDGRVARPYSFDERSSCATLLCPVVVWG